MTEVSRRGVLLAGVGAATIPLTGLSAPAFATQKLKIGFISPVTGRLGSFGQTDGFVLASVRKALSKGVLINGKTYEVEFLDRDTQSDPSRAGQLAKDLITNSGIDLMLAVSTPETINPVSDACEAAGVPCLSTVMPWEAWYFGRGAKPGQPSPFKWTFHFGFGVAEFLKSYVSQWSLIPTNKKVGVMYPNDADGNAIRAVLAPQLTKAGFTVVDPGAYETGTTDYSTQIALFKKEGIEIFNTFPIPPDFAAFWRQAAQQGLHKQIKIVQTAKTGAFAPEIEALGSLGLNLANACYWHRTFPYKSSLTGQNGMELADSYEKATGKQWTQQLGSTLSLVDAGIAALIASGDPTNKSQVAKALSTLKTTTIGGVVDFTSGPVRNVAHGPLLGCQWVKAKTGKHKVECVITENANDRSVPLGAKLLPYNV